MPWPKPGKSPGLLEKPLACGLERWGDAGWAPLRDGTEDKQPPLLQLAPATAGGSLDSHIPGQRFSTCRLPIYMELWKN